MSILNKLKAINSNKAAQLFERHPLAGESLEMRLQYLSGVALAVAIDRQPTDTERQAFSGLANSLSVDAADAEEQLKERASVDEDDITVLFDAIREKSAAWIYLIDLAWLHAADGGHDAGELEVTEQLADLLGIHSDDVKTLHSFALALKLRKLADLVAQIPKLPPHPQFQTHLPELLKPCFPYAGVLQFRWIDHGDGTVTDSTTKLMWSRYCIGRSWESGNVVGTATIFPRDSLAVKTPEHALLRVNNSAQIGGHLNWRYPCDAELAVLFNITAGDQFYNGAWKDVVFPKDPTETVFFLEKPTDNRQRQLLTKGKENNDYHVVHLEYNRDHGLHHFLSVYAVIANYTAAFVCRDWL